MDWYSTQLRFVCLIEGEGAVEYEDRVFVFRSEDFDSAFQRAIQIGQDRQEEYINGLGQRIRLRFKEVTCLDFVSSGEVDGCEVNSQPVALANGEEFEFDASFDATQSKPSQTI